MTAPTLDAFLNSRGLGADVIGSDVVEVVRELAAASIKIRSVVNQGAIGAAFAGSHAGSKADRAAHGDLDAHADTIFIEAMRSVAVAFYSSEGLEGPIILDAKARLAVAIDALDGSSNMETNSSIATIFSILPVDHIGGSEPQKAFLQPGRKQLASGFFIYGPQLALVLTFGSGTHVFVFSARLGAYVQAYDSHLIPPRAHEFAIDGSNYRHWHESVRLYIDDCLRGAEGPRERDFSMRWTASLVADTYRILVRGGVFLHPADIRQGRSCGHLRLVHEANPIAMVVEQAGGSATDTVNDILDIIPQSLDQKTPLIFGSSREVARIARYHTDPSMIAERAPLFGTRGLFRA
jgi:fructose-1,6-bisphosphatase I